MIIAGGTYTETVIEPDSKDLMGSGMRAAAALAPHDNSLRLVTAVDDAMAEEAELVAEALGVRRTLVERSEPVGFRYMTPISSPLINGVGAIASGGVREEADTALLFGFVERGEVLTSVDARTVVLDPQKPRDTDRLNLSSIQSERLVLVANRSETRQLARGEGSVAAAARKLLSDPRLDAVVTKQGAAGSLVSWRSGTEIHQETVGAHPTNRVWPIGSGDAFSAGYAFALQQGADYVEAARVGSRSAAHWCSTRQPSLPVAVLAGEDVSDALRPRRARVYVAGPFFTTGERWLVETVRDQLDSLGVIPWSPVHEVGHGENIAHADLAGLRSSDAVLALLDHSDSGTIFEVGWAVAAQIPVVGFGRVVEKEGMKMLGGSSVELHRDLSTACYRAAWAAMGLSIEPGWMTT